MRARPTTLTLILLAATAVAAFPEDTKLLLRRIDPMARVAGTGDIADAGPLKLFAARREVEPFQFVVLARGGVLKNVAIKASGLLGPAGAKIISRNIDNYRQHYIRFKRSLKDSPLPPGSYPDALIPLRSPYEDASPSAAKYPGAPFDMAAGENQPIWVDIRVPAKAEPGLYRGTISVSADGGLEANLSYSLRVWNFTLPKAPSLKSSFGAYRVYEYYDLDWHTNRHYVMSRRYSDAIVDHRLAITWSDDMQFDADEDGNIELLDRVGELGSAQEVFDHYMKKRGMSTLSLPIWSSWPISNPLGEGRAGMIAYLRNFRGIARQGGWDDRLYAYVIDEPNNGKAYQKVRQWGALLDEAGEEFPLMVTEQTIPDNKAWGTLVGAVDIWCPLPALFNEQSARERRNAGDEIWIYTALSQDGYSPKWLLDHWPIEYRIYPWLCYNYGITGLLYWETTFWEESHDPWTKASTIYDRYVGDGQLFYPGTVETVGFDGPVASMRLKWIREGMDDYDYTAALEALGDGKYLERRVKAVASSWKKWTTDPGLLMKQRKKIGRRIEKLSAR